MIPLRKKTDRGEAAHAKTSLVKVSTKLARLQARFDQEKAKRQGVEQQLKKVVEIAEIRRQQLEKFELAAVAEALRLQNAEKLLQRYLENNHPEGAAEIRKLIFSERSFTWADLHRFVAGQEGFSRFVDIGSSYGSSALDLAERFGGSIERVFVSRTSQGGTASELADWLFASVTQDQSAVVEIASPEEVGNEPVDFVFLGAGVEASEFLQAVEVWFERLREHGVIAGVGWEVSPERRVILETFFAERKMVINRLHQDEDCWYVSKAVSFSQFGQDQKLLLHHFSTKNDGIFLEIGADDGLLSSNTLFFEKLGWTGVCIEPSPERFKALSRNRACICENVAVSSHEGTAQFLDIAGPSHQLSGLVSEYSDAHLERIDRQLSTQPDGEKSLVTVDCVTADALLARHEIRKIDYCTIDTEGNELDVLKTFDFDRVSIDIIQVENNYADDRVQVFLESHGYSLIDSIGIDDIFLRRDSKLFIEAWTFSIGSPVKFNRRETGRFTTK